LRPADDSARPESSRRDAGLEPDVPGHRSRVDGSVTDLFGRAGRHWLSQQQLPSDERRTVEALIRQLDFHGAEIKAVDGELAVEASTIPSSPG
jgi:hypothetical protein